MHWVVTTGSTVDKARDRALDALGIDESELEFEVLNEAGSSLFGLRTTDARIRAHVRPTRPRPKLDRRARRKGRGKGKPRGKGKGRSSRSKQDSPAPNEPSAPKEAAAPKTEQTPNRPRPDKSEPPKTPKPAAPTKTAKNPDEGTGATMSDISISEQEPTATDFVRGLVEAFGFDATVESQEVDEETVEIDITGADLGLLVGQRGNTLTAIQELTRTAVAQQHSGRLDGRLRVDAAGYRAKRKVALARFTQQQAERVKETGEPVALEPMSPPDRKTVHDAANEIDGVHTTSRGEDRRRHVVILPDD